MIKATIVLEDGVELSTSEQVDFVRELVEKYFIKNPDVSSRQLRGMIFVSCPKKKS